MVMLSCTLKSYGSQLGPMVCMAAPAEGGRVSLVACLELPRNACSKRALCPLQGVTGYACVSNIQGNPPNFCRD